MVLKAKPKESKMAIIEIRKNVRFGGKSIYCGRAVFENGIHPVRIAGFLGGNAIPCGDGWKAEAEVWNDDANAFGWLKKLAFGRRDAENLISWASEEKAVYKVVCR